jgi:hypothetical protein
MYKWMQIVAPVAIIAVFCAFRWGPPSRANVEPPGSLKAADIAASAVSTEKIAADAVTSAKIVDLGVSNADLATGAVTSIKIADCGVSNVDLGTGVVSSAKILDADVSNADLSAEGLTCVMTNVVWDGNTSTWYFVKGRLSATN